METRVDVIEEISIVKGKKLNEKWTEPMMIVFMESGAIFVENMKNHKYAKWEPHTELIHKIGETVYFEVREDSNCHYPFMKLISKKEK